MTRSEFAKQLQRFMNRYDRFLLSGHVRPDGDSVGATTALALALMDQGKEVRVVYDGDAGRYGEVLSPVPALPADMNVRDAGNCFESGSSFAFMVVDCPELARTGRAEEALMQAEASLLIDHHTGTKAETDFSYGEPETASTCQILFALFKEIGITVTTEIASALFLGIAFDTGGFRHSNTSPETFAVGAELRALGVNTTEIVNHLFYTRKFADAKLEAVIMSKAFQKAKLYDGKILISCMTQSDFEAIGAEPKAADMVVSRLKEVEEAVVACYLREIEDGVIRANLRSDEPVDVARVASIYGGGGHMRAAGCTASDPMLLVKENLLAAIRRQLAEGDTGACS